MQLLLFLILIAFSSTCAIGQDNSQDHDMHFYADVMVNASDPVHRYAAGERFYPLFLESIKKEQSFLNPYENLKWIYQLMAPDSSFRVFTWQIDQESKFQSFGVIQLSNGSLFELKESTLNLNDAEYMELDAENWFGHIYYNMEVVQINDIPSYVLFGYDGHSEFEKRKVIEVLSFVNEKPVFGKEIFKYPQEDRRPLMKYRVGFQYASDAVMFVNYNPHMEMIVFDHLMEVIGQLPGQGPTMVPDGTYEGFVFKDGYYEYSEKLFHEVMDEAPRPQPILDGRKKNIIGKKN